MKRAQGILAALVGITATLTVVTSTGHEVAARPVTSALVSPQADTQPVDIREEMAQMRASRTRSVLPPKKIVTTKSKPVTTQSHKPRSKPVIKAKVVENKHVSVPRGTLKAYAESLVGATQFSCLEPLWEHESGWSTTATNGGSAYGIPQSLPGSKMASEGADWRTNGRTQIRWGVKYIAGRYGNACGAWAHYRAHSWY